MTHGAIARAPACAMRSWGARLRYAFLGRTVGRNEGTSMPGKRTKPDPIRDLIERAEPGAWRDALESLAAGRDAHEALWARSRAAYDTFYDTPERLRAHLDPEVAEAVAAVEASAAGPSRLWDALPLARDVSFAEKAARLGAEPRRAGEPDWVRLLRDLHALRAWRVAHLDGVDVHLPPFLLRKPERGSNPSMFDRAFLAWGKAAGVKVDPLRARIVALAKAGLIPAVEAIPGIAMADRIPHAYPGRPDPAVARLAALVESEGAGPLLAELAAAAETLPATDFPVPSEAIAALEAQTGPRPR